MKTLILLIVCTLILIAPAANAQSSGKAVWSIYTIKGEHFTIILPTVPALETSREVRSRPQRDRKRHILKTTAAGVVYTVHVVENPKPRLSLEAFIREQLIVNPVEKLTNPFDVTLEGVAGKGFLYPDGKGVVEFFAKENRLYDIRAYGAPVDDDRIRMFIRYISLRETKGSYEISESVQSATFDSASGKTYLGKEVDTKVRLVKKPEPTYSEPAKGEQITGTVVLKCIFAADGTVTNIRVIAGLPGGLTEKAIEAARKIKFIPATKDGQNVSMWMQLEYNFNLY